MRISVASAIVATVVISARSAKGIRCAGVVALLSASIAAFGQGTPTRPLDDTGITAFRSAATDYRKLTRAPWRQTPDSRTERRLCYPGPSSGGIK